MKRILILAGLCLFASIAMGQDAMVTIGSVTQLENDTIRVIFDLENDTTIGGLEFKVSDEPNALELISDNVIAMGRLASVNQLSLSSNDANDVSHFIWFSMALDTIGSGSDQHIQADFLKTTGGNVSVKIKVYDVFPSGPLGETLSGSGDSLSTDLVKIWEPTPTPTHFQLRQNYPNPFNPTTEIQYQIPKQAYVTLQVYDLKGNLIKTLAGNVHQPGLYRVIWNGKNEQGTAVASGIYLYKLSSPEKTLSNKMILLR